MFLSGREEVSHILTPVVYRLYCHILPMLMNDLPYHYRSPVMLIDSNPHGFNPWVQSMGSIPHVVGSFSPKT